MKTRLKFLFPHILILGIFFLSACSTRGIHDRYFGATEQRLVTQSIDKIARSLPEADFGPLTGQPVYIACHFIEKNESLNFARNRIAMELGDKYDCQITDTPESAQWIVHFFFNAIGTDRDTLGFTTPEFLIPGAGGLSSINVLSLEMYHGVSELYYYIMDKDNHIAKRGDKIKSTIRTDRLSIPILSIPINTLK